MSPRPAHQCPQGHWLDPCWEVCPRCVEAQLAERVVGWLVFTRSPLQGQHLMLYPEVNTIGGGWGCSIILADKRLSLRHCAIDCRTATSFVVDLDSAGGTYVNHKRVRGRRALQDRDRLQLGELELRYVDVG